MKSLPLSLLALALSFSLAAGLSGCKKETEKGGPGAKKTPEGDPQNKDNTFSLGLPRTETDLAPGQNKTLKININRGDQFKQDVTVTFEAPEGVMIEPKSSTVAAGTKELQITVTADKKATAGKHSVKVTGKPDDGKDVSGSFVVEIKKGDNAG